MFVDFLHTSGLVHQPFFFKQLCFDFRKEKEPKSEEAGASGMSKKEKTELKEKVEKVDQATWDRLMATLKAIRDTPNTKPVTPSSEIFLS